MGSAGAEKMRKLKYKFELSGLSWRVSSLFMIFACFTDDLVAKRVFAICYYVLSAASIGFLGLVLRSQLGAVCDTIRELIKFGMIKLEKTASASNGTTSDAEAQERKKLEDSSHALVRMLFIRQQLTSQGIQNGLLAAIFAVWPWLQLKAEYNLVIAYGTVLQPFAFPLGIFLISRGGNNKKKKNTQIAPATATSSVGANSQAESSAAMSTGANSTNQSMDSSALSTGLSSDMNSSKMSGSQMAQSSLAASSSSNSS